MAQKSYKQLREDMQEIMRPLAKEVAAKGEVEFLTGKVIALCAVMAQLLEKLDKESAG